MAQWSTVAGPSPSASPSHGSPRAPLGALVEAGRVEMAGSGFAITIPEDWRVEVAAPDADITTADPGDAWEALHAQNPDGTMACSVVVGVATTSLAVSSGIKPGSVTTTPAWDEHDPTLLWVPEPRLAPAMGYGYVVVMGEDRLHLDDPHLDHDVSYAISCLSDRELGEGAGRELDEIMETLELLPLGG